MAAAPVSTEGLVLRCTPFGETSLIVALLTAEHGQVHLMFRGARRTGRRQFPEVDLMRLVQVVYRPSLHGEIHNARDATCSAAWPGLARDPGRFATAGWLCRLALANTVENQPAPRLLAALRTAFTRLEGDTPVVAVRFAAGLVALAEHGVLPDLADDPPRRRQLAHVLAAATDPGIPLPAYAPAVWERLHAWWRDFAPAVGLVLPQEG